VRRLCAIIFVSALLTAVAACKAEGSNADRAVTAHDFPRAFRPVSQAARSSVGSEQARDDRREAATVMELAQLKRGMTVADIGAGEGYYTVRLAERVGETGRVLAQDIDPDVIKALGSRVERERLDNVSIKLGASDDPGLPANSFDRIFLVHMYHEVAEPYAFLWRLRPALRSDGAVVVVDVDRPTDQHGINPQLLFCEFAQVGFRLVEFVRKPELAGYYAQFEPVGARPEPDEILPCRHSDDAEGNAAAPSGEHDKGR
jgi:ubiquinone/menaquinone biosynthesis C-methylase UbiE